MQFLKDDFGLYKFIEGLGGYQIIDDGEYRAMFTKNIYEGRALQEAIDACEKDLLERINQVDEIPPDMQKAVDEALDKKPSNVIQFPVKRPIKKLATDDKDDGLCFDGEPCSGLECGDHDICGYDEQNSDNAPAAQLSFGSFPQTDEGFAACVSMANDIFAITELLQKASEKNQHPNFIASVVYYALEDMHLPGMTPVLAIERAIKAKLS
jgi:hypothetical protein